MNRPLLLACVGALAGFGGWIWLTGPGTSVPNALIALVVGIACGRLTWMLVGRRDEEEPAGTATRMEVPPASSRLAPPPPDSEPWRRPGSGQP
ncbi:hypothetical protein [Muricoccus radiodurans]|uniref:hypothetical protein n=1 Tax=Muricoccus radiodurans TaxID=2231721 RepID=UPI003CF7C5BC